MAIEEAVTSCIAKDKLVKENDELEKTFVMGGLRYLFHCYNRIEVEEQQYPKVKYILYNIIYFIFTPIPCIFFFYRGVVLLLLFLKHYKVYVHNA